MRCGNPILRSPARAFGLRKEERQHVKYNDSFFCASALFRSQCLFFAYFFLARQNWDQTANQRSVCCLERTSSAMDETCRLRRGEGYAACEDESPKAQLQRRCKNGTSGASGKEFRSDICQGQGQGPQSLQTSTHAVYFEYCSSSGMVSSIALFALPAAGKTVSNRCSDSSR